jgi:hypothetical protein
MLRGIDVGGILNTLKESVLLKGLQYEEELEHLRTLILFKGAKLDNSNKEEVKKFNELLNTYNSIRNPQSIEDKKQILKNKQKELNNLKNLDFSKMKLMKNNPFNDLNNEKKDKIIKIL